MFMHHLSFVMLARTYARRTHITYACRTHTHTHIHTHTHTHIQLHTRTHTHAHIQADAYREAERKKEGEILMSVSTCVTKFVITCFSVCFDVLAYALIALYAYLLTHTHTRPQTQLTLKHARVEILYQVKIMLIL